MSPQNDRLLVLLLFCCTFAGACQDPFGLRLLPDNGLMRVSSERLAVTEMTIYAINGSVDVNRLVGYPLDWLPDDHWHQRLWDDKATNSELRSLLDWLAEQREMWSDRNEHPGEVRRITEIMKDLSSWQDPARIHTSRISYSYSSTCKPGIAGFKPYGWLYLYYLNSEGTAITEVTNAFR